MTIGEVKPCEPGSMIQMSLWLWFVGKYNKWDKVDPAELFSQAPTEKKEANPKLNMVKFLQVCGACKSTGTWGGGVSTPALQEAS